MTADDVYAPLARSDGLAPGYTDRLRDLRVLDGLTTHDACQAAEQIEALVYRFGNPHSMNVVLENPRRSRAALLEQLYNKSINVPVGADSSTWDDPPAAGRAFTLAGTVLRSLDVPQPRHAWDYYGSPEHQAEMARDIRRVRRELGWDNDTEQKQPC